MAILQWNDTIGIENNLLYYYANSTASYYSFIVDRKTFRASTYRMVTPFTDGPNLRLAPRVRIQINLIFPFLLIYRIRNVKEIIRSGIKLSVVNFGTCKFKLILSAHGCRYHQLEFTNEPKFTTDLGGHRRY